MTIHTIVKQSEDSDFNPIKIFYSAHLNKSDAENTLSRYKRMSPSARFEIIETPDESVNQAHDEIDQKIGLAIATCLSLTEKSDGRFDTLWGNKTAIGLARTMRRIINETK